MRSLTRSALALGVLALTFAAADPAGAAPNQAPVTVDDHFVTQLDTQYELDAPGFLANDYDPEGGPLTTYTETPVRAGGTLYKRANGWFRFVPTPGFVGTESFPYFAIDEVGEQTRGTITIEVQSPNQAPVANDDQYEAVAGQTLRVPAAGVLGNDHDPEGGPLTALLENCGGAGGPHNVQLRSDGSLEFTPAAAVAGRVDCRYIAIDETGLATPAFISFKVRPPDAPVPPVAPPRRDTPRVTG